MSASTFFNTRTGLATILASLLSLPGLASGQESSKPAAKIEPGVKAKANPFADVPASHQQIADVAVKSTDGKYRLQTVSVDAEGRVLALTAPPKSFGAPLKDVSSEVHVYSADGKFLALLTVDFHASSVAGGPDGHIYVAGDGRAVKFSGAGKQLAVLELPHVQQILQDKDGLRKLAADQLQRQRESMQNVLKSYGQRIQTLEAKKEEDRTPLETRQLDQLKKLVKQFDPKPGNNDNAMLDQIMSQMTGRVRTINALAFSARDVFVATGDIKGFGYAIWRMDHQFKTPKQIMTDVRGCCGQMDIQTSGDDLIVAENTSHRFARYDREGTQLGAWGKRSAQIAELECFGGCCNPMNVCATAKGDIFTAESEGVIKRFSAKGDFLGLVATVPLTGAGCKNVAFGVSRDENQIYFLDLNGSRFLILEQKAKAK